MASHRRGTATTSTLAQVNRTAIVEELRRAGSLSRQQLGAATGLSAATVNRLTASLIAEGLVTLAGQEPSTGGRPSVLLKYSGASRVVAAIQLKADRASGVLVDFDGLIVHRLDARFGPWMLPAADRDPAEKARDEATRLSQTLDLLDRLLAAAESSATPCLAVALAVPGVVHHPDGTVNSMPELGWADIALGDVIRRHTALPLVIENDANALVFGELHRGAGLGLTSMVALLLENGLGAGIVTNGELHRGARAEAGEIGYLLMDRASLDRSYSDFGDLEDRVGAIALTRRAIERGMQLPADGVLTAHAVFRRATSGEVHAQDLADEILDMVAIAIAALVIVLDPELVVIGSSFVGGESERGASIVAGIRGRLTGRILRVPRIEIAANGDDSVLVGAAELAMAQINGFTYVEYRQAV